MCVCVCWVDQLRNVSKDHDDGDSGDGGDCGASNYLLPAKKCGRREDCV